MFKNESNSRQETVILVVCVLKCNYCKLTISTNKIALYETPKNVISFFKAHYFQGTTLYAIMHYGWNYFREYNSLLYFVYVHHISRYIISSIHSMSIISSKGNLVSSSEFTILYIIQEKNTLRESLLITT